METPDGFSSLEVIPSSKGVAKSMAKVLSIDMSRSLYRTQLHQAVINTRHVASSTSKSQVRRNESTVTNVCVFVSGTLDSMEAWIQNLCVDLSGANYPTCQSTQKVTQTLDIKLECSMHSCAGCQSSSPSTRWEHLQNKCYMASSCAVSKCVGTTVNMRRPLCNLGPVLADSLYQTNIVATSAWMAISHTIITVVELSERRRRE